MKSSAAKAMISRFSNEKLMAIVPLEVLIHGASE
jgi:hypothetical protein